MKDNPTIIEIILAGDAVQDGRVSVSLFTKTLQSIQDVIYQVADSQIRKAGLKIKNKPSVIKKECELFLVRTAPGSLHAVMELPQKALPLFDDMPNFSSSVMLDTRETFTAFVEGDFDKLKKVLPDNNIRRQVVNRIDNIMPSGGSDYSLTLGFDGQLGTPLVRPAKEIIEKLIGEPSLLTDDKDQEIKYIEAKGMARVENGKIKKWIEYYKISELPLDLDHVWRTNEIKTKDKVLHLNHPIACVIERQEDILFAEDENLGILAYGSTREDVIQEYTDEFAAIWEGIAMVEDNKLTQDALILKNKLLELVGKVVPYGDAENKGHQERLNQ